MAAAAEVPAPTARVSRPVPAVASTAAPAAPLPAPAPPQEPTAGPGRVATAVTRAPRTSREAAVAAGARPAVAAGGPRAQGERRSREQAVADAPAPAR